MSNVETTTADQNNVLPFNVGIAPSQIVQAASPVGKTYEGPSILVNAQGNPFSPEPAEPELYAVNGETLNSLTWDQYLAWRKTKCRPFDYETEPKFAVSVEFSDALRCRALEEIDQAILEFIGEVAELGELFIENGPIAFWENLRVKMIDECGDIFFCGMWALDAWGKNPFCGVDDLEMLRVEPKSELAMFAEVIASRPPAEVLGNQKFVSILDGMIFNLMAGAQTNAGLLANSFKKLRYQRREQDVEKQVKRIVGVLVAVNQILIIANSSVEEALQTNMKKLDSRYPDGYKPGQGGGIRVGEGK